MRVSSKKSINVESSNGGVPLDRSQRRYDLVFGLSLVNFVAWTCGFAPDWSVQTCSCLWFLVQIMVFEIVWVAVTELWVRSGNESVVRQVLQVLSCLTWWPRVQTRHFQPASREPFSPRSLELWFLWFDCEISFSFLFFSEIVGEVAFESMRWFLESVCESKIIFLINEHQVWYRILI